jgi:polyhydroxyalkanoate synthesis regulator phasin
MSKRTILASAAAAIVLAAGAGGAYAAGGFSSGPGTNDGSGDAVLVKTGPGGPFGSEAIADYLGLSQSELRAQLESGKTLAQIATAQGKSVSGLEDVIYSDAKADLDQAVADGKLSASEESTMLADLKAHLDDIVNGTGPHGEFHAGPMFGPAVASYLGLTESELRTQLESGKTLAQIATAQGKSVEGLKAAILAEAKSKLDEAVASGKLTASEEQTMLDKLQANLDDIVNNSGPPGGLHVEVGIFGSAVASYLGLSETELRTQLESGKTLAQIATTQGKSVDGLKAAILAEAKSHLDEAVAAGKITSAEAEQMLADLKSHIDDMVNRTGPPGPRTVVQAAA